MGPNTGNSFGFAIKSNGKSGNSGPKSGPNNGNNLGPPNKISGKSGPKSSGKIGPKNGAKCGKDLGPADRIIGKRGPIKCFIFPNKMLKIGCRNRKAGNNGTCRALSKRNKGNNGTKNGSTDPSSGANESANNTANLGGPDNNIGPSVSKSGAIGNKKGATAGWNKSTNPNSNFNGFGTCGMILGITKLVNGAVKSKKFRMPPGGFTNFLITVNTGVKSDERNRINFNVNGVTGAESGSKAYIPNAVLKNSKKLENTFGKKGLKRSKIIEAVTKVGNDKLLPNNRCIMPFFNTALSAIGTPKGPKTGANASSVKINGKIFTSFGRASCGRLKTLITWANIGSTASTNRFKTSFKIFAIGVWCGAI